MTIIFRRPTPLELVTIVAVAIVAYLAFLAPDADRSADGGSVTIPSEQTAAPHDARARPIPQTVTTILPICWFDSK